MALDELTNDELDEGSELKRLARIPAPNASNIQPLPNVGNDENGRPIMRTLGDIRETALGPDASTNAPAPSRIAAPNMNAGARGISPRPIAPPTAAQTDEKAATDELGRLRSTGSGISQIKNPIGRGLLRGLNVIGSIGLPGSISAIPGTEEHHRALIGQQERRLATDTGVEEKEAQAEEMRAHGRSLDRDDAMNRALAKIGYTASVDDKGNLSYERIPGFEQKQAWEPIIAGDKTIAGFRNTTTGELLGPNSPNLTPEMKDIFAAAKPVAKGETQEQNKLAFQSVIGKVDAAGLSSDPAKLNASLDAALKKGVITKEEHSLARSYLAANATPSTNLTVHVEGNQAAADTKSRNGYYAYNGKIVRGDRLTDEQRDQAMPVKDVEKAEGAIRNTNSTLATFNRYGRDLQAANLSQDDVRALQVLTSPEKVAQGFFEKDAAGVLDSIFGEPLTGYSTKAMGGIMTKDQYDKLSPDAQKLLVGYFSSIISNFQDMKQRLGGIGRNESTIQAEIHTIPLPYIGKDIAKEALDRKTSDVESRNIYLTPTAPAEGSNQQRATAPRDFGPAPKGKADGTRGTLPDGTKVINKGGRVVEDQGNQ